MSNGTNKPKFLDYETKYPIYYRAKISPFYL